MRVAVNKSQATVLAANNDDVRRPALHIYPHQRNGLTEVPVTQAMGNELLRLGGRAFLIERPASLRIL
jgi:hypothetical protein